MRIYLELRDTVFSDCIAIRVSIVKVFIVLSII